MEQLTVKKMMFLIYMIPNERMWNIKIKIVLKNVTTMKVIIKIIWAQEVNNEYNKPCSIKNQYRDQKTNTYKG